MYHALYRKYRPMDFDSVVGQDPIIKTLKNSIIHNNFSHAYMFFGSRGTGKTTVSKIFARNINCLSPVDGSACHNCSACAVSFSKDCVDIIEIDAASNNGVDEIRELKNNINLVPSELRYKVYIIDEVHMLSDSAFNALLKTLEEPPEHVVFILATTDPQKVPETIVSRCQCFSFKRISDDVIFDRLSHICNEEKIDIDDIVLKKISLLSDGGLRDALGYLDKMTAYTSSKITINDFNEVNGIISDDDLSKFVSHIFSGDIQSFLSDISYFNNGGKNLIQIMIQLIDYCRDLIVNYYLKSTVLDYPLNLFQSFVSLLNERLFDIKKASNTKVYVEMLILNFIDDFVIKKDNINDSKTTSTNNLIDKNQDNSPVEKKLSSDILKNDVISNSSDIENNNLSQEKNNSSIKSVDYLSDDIDSNENLDEIPKIINIDDIIKVRINNTFATADKSLLKLEIDNFNLLKDFSFDQEIGYLVNSLLDGKIRVVGSNDLIISYETDASVNQNLVNLVKINEVYNKITNSNKNIAFVSDDQWNKLKNEYISKLKQGIHYDVIPEPDLLFEEIKKNDIISNSAISLFGEDIVEFV